MLAAGTRLGPYEILDRIGAGGMGEVYLARDTRLDRRVAIKILKTATVHPHSLQRFEREARADFLHHVINVVAIDGDELPFGYGRQRFFRHAGQVGQHADDERQFTLLDSISNLDVVCDLHSWRTNAADFLLQTLFGHDQNPRDSRRPILKFRLIVIGCTACEPGDRWTVNDCSSCSVDP